MEGCFGDDAWDNKRKEVGISVWDAPPPGILDGLIDRDIPIGHLRLVNSKWCREVNSIVKSVSVPGDNLSKPELEERLTAVSTKFPFIDRIRGIELDSLEPLVGRFRGKLVHLELHHCDCDRWQLLAEMSKLETLEIGPFGSCQDDLALLSTLTSLRMLVVRPGNLQCFADANALSCLTNLEKLALQYCKIQSLHFLESLTKLLELHFQGSLEDGNGNACAISALTNLTNLAFVGRSFGDSDAPSLSHLVNLRGLTLQFTCMSDVGFKHVSHLTKLNSLNLYCMSIMEAGLEPISCLSNLVLLRLEGIGEHRILEGGLFLTHLKKLESLTMLSILQDGVVHSIALLESLTYLHMHVDHVTSNAFSLLGNLEKLEILALSNARDQSVMGPLYEWPCLPQLRKLTLNGCRWADESLVHLTRLRKLEELWLSSKGVTDVGLLHLTKLTRLKKLHWWCKNVSYQYNGRILEEAMQSCEILGEFVF